MSTSLHASGQHLRHQSGLSSITHPRAHQQQQRLRRVPAARGTAAAGSAAAAAAGYGSRPRGGSIGTWGCVPHLAPPQCAHARTHGACAALLRVAQSQQPQQQQHTLAASQPLAQHMAAAPAAAAAATQAGSPPWLLRGACHPRRRLAAAGMAAAAAAADPGSSGSSSSSAQPDSAEQPSTPQQQQQQAPAGLELPPLELPPSRSAALWLGDLSRDQLAQQAANWGYEQVGVPLPEGLSLEAVAETLPDQVFDLDLAKALGYLGLSLAVMAAGYAYLAYWHSICPLWQQVLAWGVIGTGYYGAFQTAVDCAHFAFWPQRPLLQDLLGAALMAPGLVNYEVFRLKYFNHIMCTNQLHEDLDAWHPLLPADLAAIPRWRRTLTALVMATPLKLLASVGQWAASLEGFDLRLHPRQTRAWVWLSWALPLGFAAAVFPALIAAGGLGGLVTYWLGPWLAFHAWLSVLSLVQHTGPHIAWTEEGLTYDHAQAVINGTVSLKVPAWLEVLLHHANHHLPAHVSISIPSYNLPLAQSYLEQRLGKYLTLATLNANLLRNLVTAWLVYDEQQQRYLDFDQAEPLVQQAQRQQQQAREQQQQEQERSARAATPAGSGGGTGGGAGAAGAGAGAGPSAPAGHQAAAEFAPSIPLDRLLGLNGAQRHSGSSNGASRGDGRSDGSSSSSSSSNGGQLRGQQQRLAGSSSSSSSTPTSH